MASVPVMIAISVCLIVIHKDKQKDKVGKKECTHVRAKAHARTVTSLQSPNVVCIFFWCGKERVPVVVEPCAVEYQSGKQSRQ
jgi:hypothetical protein